MLVKDVGIRPDDWVMRAYIHIEALFDTETVVRIFRAKQSSPSHENEMIPW
jgi:hypothetical protein